MEEALLILLQLLLEFFAEVLLEAAPEQLFSLLQHAFLNATGKRHNPWAAIFGYLLLGQAIGWLSWLLFPHHFIADPHWRQIALFITPAITGLIACTIGAYRAKHGQSLVRLDRFGYAYAFAFSVALARYAGSTW